MIKKEYPKSRQVCKVTFYTPKLKAETVQLVGDFNNWELMASPMQKLSDKRFKLIIELEKGKEYQYRFFVDQKEWLNDPEADRCAINEFGSENCIIVT